jgi:antitoxin HicB
MSSTLAPSAVGIKKTLARSLRSKMKAEKTTVSALAKQIGTGRTAIRRLLDEENTSVTLFTMSRAAEALGLRLTLEATPLSPAQLKKLADRMVESSPRAAKKLEDDIVAGFYGKKQRA